MGKRVLIVGGVAGGASCAARLRRLDETAEIVVFERGAHVSFANCGLPYFVGNVIAEERGLIVAFALAELVWDQLPSASSRTLPVPFAARVLAGAFAGAVIGVDRGYWVAGAFAGTRRGRAGETTEIDRALAKTLDAGDVAAMLAMAVKARKNILISGGTSSPGKPTQNRLATWRSSSASSLTALASLSAAPPRPTPPAATTPPPPSR